MLPFIYEGFATKETFFGREEELKKIKSITANSNYLRRFGKSSLVKEQMRRDSESLYIYFDIFDITSENDFARLFLKAIADSQKGSLTSTISKLSKIFKRIGFEVVFDSTTGKTKLSPSIKDTNFEDAIGDIFGALFTISNKQKIVVIIEEFQQLSLIKDVEIDK